MKNELYLAQYVICKTRDIVEVFSKRLELPNDICYYLLSEFVGYNLTDRGTLKKEIMLQVVKKKYNIIIYQIDEEEGP